jgi:hypothetical protein
VVCSRKMETEELYEDEIAVGLLSILSALLFVAVTAHAEGREEQECLHGPVRICYFFGCGSTPAAMKSPAHKLGLASESGDV